MAVAGGGRVLRVPVLPVLVLVLVLLVFGVAGVAGSRASGEDSATAEALQRPREKRNVDGDLRLVDGGAPDRGRLEVFYDGQWGNVCDDWFSDASARVACRQMGLPWQTATSRCCAHFGRGTSLIWLDDVACAGTETRLTSCPRNAWGVHDCTSSESVGVVCQGSIPTTPPPTPTQPGGNDDPGVEGDSPIVLYATLIVFAIVAVIVCTCFCSNSCRRRRPSAPTVTTIEQQDSATRNATKDEEEVNNLEEIGVSNPAAQIEWIRMMALNSAPTSVPAANAAFGSTSGHVPTAQVRSAGQTLQLYPMPPSPSDATGASAWFMPTSDAVKTAPAPASPLVPNARSSYATTAPSMEAALGAIPVPVHAPVGAPLPTPFISYSQAVTPTFTPVSGSAGQFVRYPSGSAPATWSAPAPEPVPVPVLPPVPAGVAVSTAPDTTSDWADSSFESVESDTPSPSTGAHAGSAAAIETGLVFGAPIARSSEQPLTELWPSVQPSAFEPRSFDARDAMGGPSKFTQLLGATLQPPVALVDHARPMMAVAAPSKGLATAAAMHPAVSEGPDGMASPDQGAPSPSEHLARPSVLASPVAVTGPAGVARVAGSVARPMAAPVPLASSAAPVGGHRLAAASLARAADAPAAPAALAAPSGLASPAAAWPQ